MGFHIFRNKGQVIVSTSHSAPNHGYILNGPKPQKDINLLEASRLRLRDIKGQNKVFYNTKKHHGNHSMKIMVTEKIMCLDERSTSIEKKPVRKQENGNRRRELRMSHGQKYIRLAKGNQLNPSNDEGVASDHLATVASYDRGDREQVTSHGQDTGRDRRFFIASLVSPQSSLLFFGGFTHSERGGVNK